ncbi:MAG: radical SAM protein [Nanoarchaeota archaeon]
MKKTKKICLVSMPFNNVFYPNIQLASLKSYINQNSPINVDLKHFNLDFFNFILSSKEKKETIPYYSFFNSYSRDLYNGDIVFACMYYPKKMSSILDVIFNKKNKTTKHKHWRKELTRKETIKIINDFKKFTEDLIKSVNWKDYFLVGFSCSFAQLFPSIYAAKLIKKANPDIKIVFGGNVVFEEQGKYILNEFNEVDFIISGEGEKPLLKMISDLTNKIIPERYIDGSKQLVKLDNLPLPDYNKFFEQHSQLKIPYLVLMLYASKGCFYNKCSFCSMNKQYSSYRIKNVNKMIDEIIELKRKYPKTVNFAFTDSMIPEPYLIKFAKEIIKRKIKISFWLELKANAKKETIKLLSKAGLKGAQIGIESFNQNILERMNKGTTVKQNIETMKIFEELNVKVSSNIITRFLNVDKKDIINTFEVLKKLKYYHPLSASILDYTYGSKEHEKLVKSGSYILADEELNYIIYANLEKYNTFLPIIPKKQDNLKEWKAVENFINEERKKKRFINSLPGIYYKKHKNKITVYVNYNKKLVGTDITKKIDLLIFNFCDSFKNIQEIRNCLSGYSKKEISESIERLLKKEILIDIDEDYMTLPVKFDKSKWK